MLTLYDYQQEALKTSDETNTLEYCVLGLVNEAGEVAGVVKKWLRGDYDEATMREKMIGELGDVLWYVAVTAHKSKAIQNYKLYDDLDIYIAPNVSREVRKLARVASKVSDAFDSEVSLSRSLHRMMDQLVGLSESCGHTIAEVAAHNIAKLRDRQERGVIRGSGDER